MFYSLLPAVTYWTVCSVFYALGLDSQKNIENKKNGVTFSQAIKRVAFFHVSQSVVLFAVENNFIPISMGTNSEEVRWYYIVFGIFWMDTIQYFTHRLFHEVPYFYKTWHKGHHDIKMTWSFAAVYNSHLEANISGANIFVTFYFWNFNMAEFAIVTSLSYVAAIMDHTEAFRHRWDKGDFHQIHHETDIRSNYQQPFFTFWDDWLGTRHQKKLKAF